MGSSIQYLDNQLDGRSEGVRQPIASASPRAQWTVYRLLLVINDITLTLGSFMFAAWVRFNVPLSVFNLEASPTIPPLPIIIFGFVPLWLAIYASYGLYQKKSLLGGTREYASVFQATSIGILVIVVVDFIQPLFAPARGWVILAWVFTICFVVIGRFSLRRVVYYLRRRGYFLSPALIIGKNAEALSLAEQLLLWHTSGLAVRGFIATGIEDKGGVESELPVLGDFEHLDDLVERLDIGDLILATSALSQEQILSVFKRYGVSSSVNMRLSSGLFEIITTGLELKEVASVPLLRINQARLTGMDWLLKSALDVSLAIIAIVIALPLMAIITLAIKLDSQGEVIYRRRVMGLNGVQFDAYKFRTMHCNGDELLAAEPDMQSTLEQSCKLKDDPRVTRVGRILRKHSLDELPQFFNVLRREMSVVGPRMIAPDELVRYEQWDMNLLTVPPGITGLWQVSGRSDLPYDKRVQLDMRYIRNWSIWLDFHILMRTILVVVNGDGAY